MRPDTGPLDLGVRPDAEPRDVGPPMDATPAPDSGFRDADLPDAPAPDAVVGMDAIVAMDAAPPTDSGVACNPAPRAPAAGDLVINEIHASPVNTAAGDANGDGTRDATADEFIEIANVSMQAIDLTGLVLGDITAVRHTFAARSLSCGQAIVVFGGGNPQHPAWRSNWIAGSSLGLNNTGDTVRLGTNMTTPDNLATVTYGSEADDGQSIVRSTDLSAAAMFVRHTAAAGAGGRLFSPGVRIDGTEF
jgi:uncharacterized protein